MDRFAAITCVVCVWITVAAAAEPNRPVCGRVVEQGTLTVLELWGSPAEAGYAHGYLMAERIAPLLDGYMFDPNIMPNLAMYETMIRPRVDLVFDWPDDAEAELRGMMRGVRDRLGPGALRSQRLGRALTLEDLKAANTLADWMGVMCSTFSAWGPLTQDGEVLTARNLDFPKTGAMQQAQIVMVRHGGPGRIGWVGVTWPGLIGVYTAMNGEGVTMLMHDANGLPTDFERKFTPRSLTLRLALERARPASYVKDVGDVLRANPVIMGNNIHASAPIGKVSGPPAVVFEYDGSLKDQGVTLRPPLDGAAMVYCTNHVRLRQQPVQCRRYGLLDRKLRGKPTLTPITALGLIRQVRQSHTVHTACLIPHQRRMLVQFPHAGDELHTIDVDKWLKRTVAPAVTAEE